MTKSILIIMLLYIIACSVSEVRPQIDPKERAHYEIGLDLINQSKYEEAESKIKALLNQFPSTRWLASAHYHLGYALEMQQKYAEAAEMYNKVVEYHQGVHSKEEVEALYRLSICFEALSNDDKVILVLNQLAPGLKYLSKEVAETEWPARLAAAYARKGNHEEAKQYYLKADAGLRKIKSGTFLDSSRWLPKTFYSMGVTPEARLNFVSTQDFENFLTSFSASQIWLLRAIETKVNPWNEMAAKHLLLVYSKSWYYIDHLPPEENKDKMLALKQKQETQKALATRLDSILENLKSEKTTYDLKKSTELWTGLKSIQTRLDLLMQQRDVRDKDIRQVPKFRGKMKK